MLDTSYRASLQPELDIDLSSRLTNFHRLQLK
jgi:hypothetical protein